MPELPELSVSRGAGEVRDGGVPVLRLRGLGSARLAPVSLEIAAGECVAIVGASGSGKSLLLRQIADLDPGSGTAELKGRDRAAMRGYEWRRHVVYCQAEAGWWDDSVAAHFADVPAAGIIAQRLEVSPAKLQAAVRELSTGERQRLALVRALMLSPAVLLLDEPTAALDEAATQRVEQELHRFLEQGGAIVMVTHNPAQAGRLAQRTFRMRAGALEAA
ncbi:ATP-binding cassette domain-containing protein [Bordetella sp. 15P40C-2]|uniref:ABC transporter ATP-binding protein n=1 Tax=Bordetella sp. 15P40C-2 TaxID=2572246 RepID=UPI0013229696|nr:ABC transporter ATP-binding protein [Bordetella sp. 15P40C-2]MVW70277.1 ATP-binding cassette domain-containing protein [Bordetella sp. 15P40C-2]